MQLVVSVKERRKEVKAGKIAEERSAVQIRKRVNKKKRRENVIRVEVLIQVE